MRILVTGGAGFIGSHYVRTMLTGGYPGFEDAEVTVFDKLTYAGNLANLAPVADNPRYRFVQGDICVADGPRPALVPGHDIRGELRRRVARRPVDPRGGRLRAHQRRSAPSRCSRRRCGTSVGRVRARLHRRGLRLDRRGVLDRGPHPRAQLARTRRPRPAATCWPAPTPQTYGLNISITRCSNNYGPYQFPEKVIPLFVTNLLDGAQGAALRRGRQRPRLAVRRRPLPRHPAGASRRARPGEFYNIGGGRELTNKELTEKLLEATGRDWSYVENIIDPRGGGHDLRYSVDYSKTAALGYAPRMTFEDGLALTVQWYRDNRGLVGAAQGPRRARVSHAPGWSPAARGSARHRPAGGPRLAGRATTSPASAAPSSTSPTRPRSARRSGTGCPACGPTAPCSSTPPRTPRSTPPRPTRRPPPWSTAGRPGWLAEELAGRRPAGARVHRLRLRRRRRPSPTPWTTPTAPRSAYGRTKLAGEQAVAAAGGDASVVRTAWVYGRARRATSCETMVRLEGERRDADRRRRPGRLAHLVGRPGRGPGRARRPARRGAAGVLHYTNAGADDLVRLRPAVFEELGADPERVRPITTAEFPRPAPRPAYSVLDGGAWTAAGLHARPAVA